MRFWILAVSAMFAVSAAGQNRPLQWPGGARAAVALTYDDGLDAHLDHAVPDLEAAKLRGTFYVSGDGAVLQNRMEEWRAIARRGHELGNHTLFHPCLRVIPGRERTFVTPERALENYNVARISTEIRTMNTMLNLMDGMKTRTLAYTCGDETAGGVSFVDSIRPMVLAARAFKNNFKALADPRTVDAYRVPSWAVEGDTAKDMIAWAEEAARSGSLAVYTFHGVGGGHRINVDREEHRKLLAWLDANRARVWTAPFRAVMQHIAAERAR